MPMPSALEIARQATLKPVAEIAEDVGIPPWLIEPYGVALKTRREVVHDYNSTPLLPPWPAFPAGT